MAWGHDDIITLLTFESHHDSKYRSLTISFSLEGPSNWELSVGSVEEVAEEPRRAEAYEKLLLKIFPKSLNKKSEGNRQPTKTTMNTDITFDDSEDDDEDSEEEEWIEGYWEIGVCYV